MQQPAQSSRSAPKNRASGASKRTALFSSETATFVQPELHPSIGFISPPGGYFCRTRRDSLNGFAGNALPPDSLMITCHFVVANGSPQFGLWVTEGRCAPLCLAIVLTFGVPFRILKRSDGQEGGCATLLPLKGILGRLFYPATLSSSIKFAAQVMSGCPHFDEGEEGRKWPLPL